MQETTVYSHFAFGYNYHLLQDDLTGLRIHGSEPSLESRLFEFLERLTTLNLSVTKVASAPLVAIQKSLSTYHERAKVTAALARRVHDAVAQVDPTLYAEIQLCRAYILSPRRASHDHLLRTPGALLAPGVFEKLPEICRLEFASSCRCVAFGLSTACAFHLMRCVEGLLRHYYFALVKRGRVKRLLWHDMIQHLRERRDSSNRSLLDSLDNIRVNFRNPTQHPDARYDLDGAQDLLFVSIEVINRISKDLEKRTA